MELQLLAFLLYMCLLGTVLGTFTGLVPGIHVNTLAVLMLASYPALEALIDPWVPHGWTAILVSSLVVSASVVHSFVDFVPSVFLGAPSPDQVLNVLPGHRMLLEGRGMDAVSAAAVGSLVGALAAVVLAIPLQVLMTSGGEEALQDLTPYVIAGTAVLLLYVEKGLKGRMWALLLMVLSGILGYCCILGAFPEWGLIPGGSMMLPLLTGLFGMPAMLLSAQNTAMPEQRMTEGINDHPLPALKGLLAGGIVGWFPGITATAGTVVASLTSPEVEPDRFISMVASVGTASTVFALVTLSVSGKGRSGTMLVVGEVMGDSLTGVGSLSIAVLLVAVLLSSLLGYAATLASGRALAKWMAGVNLRTLSIGIMVFMTVLVAVMTGPLGLLVLLTATVMGLLPTAVNVNRVHLASCLLLPVLMFYIGFDPMAV